MISPAPQVATPAPAREIPTRIHRGLDGLNFFLADVRDGLGPYLAIYLLAVRGPDEGWNPATIGVVMTIAGIAGLLAQTPAGALIDRTHHKRAVVIAAAVAVTLSCMILPFIGNFYAVAATQSLAGIAGAIFPPALAAITLGVVGPKAFSKRIGRNEAFNHAGNAVSAALAAGLAMWFGPVVVFWIMGVLAVLSIGAMLMVPAEAIDDDVARGLHHEAEPEVSPGRATAAQAPGQVQAHAHEEPSGLKVLLSNRSLLIFAALMATFHLANAAMLPSVGQKLTTVLGDSYATSLMAVCIVAAQCVMVPVAMLVGTKADAWGRKPLFLAAFGVLALRGMLYPVSDSPYWLVGVQLLDGVGAGIFGALFPVVVADLTRGTGRFNVSQGAIATAQGLGASFSASLAGAVVVGFGYSAAFMVLGGIAALGFLGYLLLMPETRDAAAVPSAAGATGPMPQPAE